MNWITGELAPEDLAAVPVPVILDGAQGAGAVPSTSRRSAAWPTPPPARSGCAAPTGPGCCGCDPEFGERVRTIAPGYMAFEDATRGLDRPSAPAGARFDAPMPREAVAFSLAAYQVLVAAGFDES